MTIYKKPEKTVFASEAKVGEVLDFPDRARGWGVTLDQTNAIPPMEWFNDLQQVNDESIQYLLQYGVAIKDNETEYPVNAITNENGELYICKKQHVNKPVSNSTYWEKIRKEASTTQPGVVALSSSVTSTDETKASTSLAVKIVNDEVKKKANISRPHFESEMFFNTTNGYANFWLDNGQKKGVFTLQNNDFAFKYRNKKGDENENVIYIPHKDGTLAIQQDVDKQIKNVNDEINFLHSLQIGIPYPYPLSSVPANHLAMNGQRFNKSTYPELAKKYPSGRLPDMRGLVIRGWDNGRSYDSGRSLLSEQGDAIRNITGNLYLRSMFDERTQSPASTGSGNGVVHFKEQVGEWGYNPLPIELKYGNPTVPTSTANFDASRVVPTASETRVKNIAFNWICLAK